MTLCVDNSLLVQSYEKKVGTQVCGPQICVPMRNMCYFVIGYYFIQIPVNVYFSLFFSSILVYFFIRFAIEAAMVPSEAALVPMLSHCWRPRPLLFFLEGTTI